jgi:hypothetical protein
LGWVPLLPDGTPDGYELASQIGCSAGCHPIAIAWWAAWRAGDLPPRPPADERGRRYAAAVVGRVLNELPPHPTVGDLRRAAYELGRWLQAGELPVEPVAAALLGAAGRGGHDLVDLANRLAADLSAGRSQPGRLPK